MNEIESRPTKFSRMKEHDFKIANALTKRSRGHQLTMEEKILLGTFNETI